jgi:ABC-type transporter Mla maintaining outer membrane lipid asymmetry permease subunit MlaE
MIPLDWLEEVGRFAHFALRGLASAPLALRRPGLLLTQFHGIFLGVLPLAGVAGMAVGAVLWLQLHYIFERLRPSNICRRHWPSQWSWSLRRSQRG